MEYNEFMEQYAKDHYCCPKCHSRNNSCTLLGFLYNPEHPEQYVDSNSVHCYTCGWDGIKHDMIPKPGKTGWRLAYLKHDKPYMKEICINADDKIYQYDYDARKKILDDLRKEQPEIYYYFYEVELK